MADCRSLIDTYLSYLGDRIHCREAGEYLIVEMPLSYHDGDELQIFVRDLSDGSLEISDLGHAVRRLNAVGIEISRARSRESRIDSIIRSRGVEFDRGRLSIICPENEFAESVNNLIQAMLQADDLIFSRRLPFARPFPTEVEDEIKVAEIEYKRGVRLAGAFGHKLHEFDFQLELPGTTVIKALSAVSNIGADDQANRLVGALIDLRPTQPQLHTLVFLDDQGEVSWDYTKGILASLTSDIFQFNADQARFRERLAELKRVA